MRRSQLQERLRAEIIRAEPDPAFVDRLATIARTAPLGSRASYSRSVVRALAAGLVALLLASGAAYAAHSLRSPRSAPRPNPSGPIATQSPDPAKTGTPTRTEPSAHSPASARPHPRTTEPAAQPTAAAESDSPATQTQEQEHSEDPTDVHSAGSDPADDDGTDQTEPTTQISVAPEDAGDTAADDTDSPGAD